MAGEWEEKSLSEVCSYINRGAAPAYVEAGGILVLNQKCVRDQRVSFSEVRRTDNIMKPVSHERMLQPLDILVNSTGVGTLGRVAQLSFLPEPATVDSHVTIMRPNPEEVHPRYLGYTIRNFEQAVEALGEGSTGQTELARSRLAAFTVPIPPLPEQRAIAHILGTLDDKIELNRRMNETLEQMARALFKSWFVDFDPVRAKAAVRREHPKWTNEQVSRLSAEQAGAAMARARGRVPLQPEIAALFPDSFQDSELGEIPKGWGVGIVKDVCDFEYGKALKADQRHPGNVPVMG